MPTAPLNIIETTSYNTTGTVQVISTPARPTVNKLYQPVIYVSNYTV